MNDMTFQMFQLMNSGFCCTQIMVKMALDAEENENVDLLRAVNGLCMGIGGTQKTCGVLTGGIAILGLYAGKGKDEEYPKQEFSQMMDEYLVWFESEFGCTECKDLIGVGCITDSGTNQSYMIKCGDILMKSYDKVLEILLNHNFEFGNRKG